MRHGHLNFALRVQHRLGSGAETWCWSPLSVGSTLGIAAQAATGMTRHELATLLLDDPAGDLHGHADLLRRGITPTTPAPNRVGMGLREAQPELVLVNTAWVDTTTSLDKRFVDDELARWPSAKVRCSPFSVCPEDGRLDINADVARSTRGLIDRILPPGSIDFDTRLVLANALYLATPWHTAFPERLTRPAEFHTSSGHVREVATMHATIRVSCDYRHGWEAVHLPARGAFRATALLPDRPISLAEAGLDAVQFAELLDGGTPETIELSLPRLGLRFAAEFQRVLRDLGVRALFESEHELRRLSPDPLTVSEVMHQATLRLDEHGVEAAGATALSVRRGAASPAPSRRIAINRPFLLAIHHQPSGVVHFLARVGAP